jgi:putative copper resistance protein D
VEDPVAVLIRLSLYISLGLAFGLSVFPLHALPPERRAPWLMSKRRLLVALAGIALLSSVFGLAVLASRMLGIALGAVDADALAMVLELPGLGPALAVRAAALSFATWALMSRRRGNPAAMLSTGLALATLAWAGHAGASEGALGALHLGSTILHLWGAGLWTGAIAAFLLLAARSAQNSEEDRHMLAAALGRFHTTGTVVVGVLVASGLVNAALIAGLPPPRAALFSPWGQLMALKLFAFSMMLGLAALNRFRLAPAFARTQCSVALIGRSLRVELALALTILGLVAWIGLLAPSGD